MEMSHEAFDHICVASSKPEGKDEGFVNSFKTWRYIRTRKPSRDEILRL